MNKEEKVFVSYSYLSLYSFLLYELLSIGIIIYLLFHFSENPVLVIVIILFLLFIIFINSIGKIIVYNDRFVITYQRLITTISTKREYRFKDIDSIDADLPLTQGRDLLTAFLPPVFSFISIWNTLFIRFKDNKIDEQKTRIYREEWFQAFKMINNLSNINITVRGLRK